VTSVLDGMTAAITTRKDEKASTLTPVGMERQTIPASFPNDMPKDVMLEAVRDIRRVVAHLLEAADALAVAAGQRGVEPVAVVPSLSETERAADAKFAESYAAKQAKAQASVFTPAPSSAGLKDTGWRCKCAAPNIITLESNKHRIYNTCKSCQDFER